MRKAIDMAIMSLINDDFCPHQSQYGFRRDQGIDNALLFAEHSLSTSNCHMAVLDLQKAYDTVNRHGLIKQCEEVLCDNTARMVATSLVPNMQTVGDLTSTTRKCMVGVPQGTSSSPPLFNIYIDPLAKDLNRTNLRTDGLNNNSFFADDASLYAQTIQNMQFLLDVCSSWASKTGMTWSTSKCKVLLQQTSEPTTQLILSGSPLETVTQTNYLGVSITSNGITAGKTIQRIQASQKTLTQLTNASFLSSRTTPKKVATIFHTFVRSKYLYAIPHIPLTQQLLELDANLIGTMFKSILRLSRLPNPRQIKLLCAMYRIRSIQTMRDDFTQQLATKLKQKEACDDAKTKKLARRDIMIVDSRSEHNALRRALRRPLTKDEINRRSLVVWNSSRTGPRRPPEFIPRRWPLALQIPNKHHVERSMAIRWHLGTFPIPLPSSPLQTHLRLQLRTLLRKPTRDVQRNDIQRARRIISAIIALAHGDVPNITNI